MSWSGIKAWWRTNKARYEKLVEEYGGMALGTYLALFAGTFLVFWVGIRWGFDPGGAASEAGTVGGAYVATKLTQPARIVATIALTPLVVRALRWVRRKEAAAETRSETPPETRSALPETRSALSETRSALPETRPETDHP